MIGIYKITNIINNKSYIGQSINIEKRIKEHFWKANCQKDISFNSILHQAIRKYGENNFKWEVLEECSIENIDKLEQDYIQKYNTISPNGYNILLGGQKIRAYPNRCSKCGEILKTKSTYCIKCGHEAQRVVEWPSRKELKQLIRLQSFISIGQQYNVSDNAIRKWCVYYNLPKTKKEIKSYTDEEWDLI